MRAKCKSLEQDLAIQVQSGEAEQARLKEQVAKLTKSSAESEDTIRTEFMKQLESVVEQYRHQCNEDKARITRELKSHYMPKLTEARQALEETCNREAELRESNKVLTEEITLLKGQLETMQELKTVHEKRINELVAELDKERNVIHVKAIAEKEKEIEKLRQRYARLETDFDNLMDIKIQMALTIDKYREILTEEERRVGLETPGRKRKRAKVVEDPPTLPVQLAIDEENGCLVVENVSDEDFSLDGWSLQSSGFVFEFPEDTLLPAKSRVSVWIGEAPNQDDEEQEGDDEGQANQVLVWEGVDCTELAEEPMCLCNEDGAVQDQIEVEAVRYASDRSSTRGGCLLM